MDLTRLYNLTTPELRKEAERRGVTDTYAMSRGQLIQAIQNRAAPAPTEPPGLLGKVFGFAKWALQAAGGIEDRLRAGGGASRTGPRPSQLACQPQRQNPCRCRYWSRYRWRQNPSLRRQNPSLRRLRRWTADLRPGRLRASFSSHGGLFEEPIPTRTMARILAEQGHYKRSLAIYSILLEDGPGDGELLAEVRGRPEKKRRRAARRRLPSAGSLAPRGLFGIMKV